MIDSDAESRSLWGKIEDINDSVDFQCRDTAKVKEKFHPTVDDYPDFCKEIGRNGKGSLDTNAFYRVGEENIPLLSISIVKYCKTKTLLISATGAPFILWDRTKNCTE